MALERFTRRAKRAIVRAQEYAEQLNHEAVSPEHIFLGLADDPQSVGTRALASVGVNVDDVREAVHAVIPRGKRIVRGGKTRFSPEGKNLLEQALREARHLRHRYIGTEHLVLALFHPTEGPIGPLFEKLGVTHDQVRDCVVQILTAEAVTQSVAEIGSAPLPPAVARSNVVMCRISDRDLEAIDMLVEARICGTRSEAAAWLISAGIAMNKALFDRLSATVQEIRRLQEQARMIIRDDAKSSPPSEAPRPPEPPGG